MKNEILIVSSYDESCGNAYFTKDLVAGINENIPCRGIGLNLRLTQATDASTVKAADKHIKELCIELANASGVNIQFEPQLYGTRGKDIIRRLGWLCTANKNTSITIHNTRIAYPKFPLLNIVKLFIFGRVLSARRTYLSHRRIKLEPETIKTVIRNVIDNDLPIIVHTSRAAKQFRQMLDAKKIHIHPLKFRLVDAEGKKTGESILEDLKKGLKLPEDAIIIGFFGYISEYKGHEEALRAIKYLPENYHLFIFGRQHPTTIRSDGSIDEYQKILLDMILSKNIVNRVHFMGEYAPIPFAELISAVDVCWLPYREVGQDGSGIASQCLDNGKRVICSASFAFDENLALDPKPFVRRFDIGNYLQLADMTRIVMDEKQCQNEVGPRLLSYTSQVELYLLTLGLKKKADVKIRW